MSEFALPNRPKVRSAKGRCDRQTLKNAGIEFIDENGGGPGVRLKKPPKKALIADGTASPS